MKKCWKMNAKIVNLPSIVGNKLSFNKMLETQLAQLVVINMSFKHGNFLCLPKTFAKFSVVITREENPLMVRHIPMWLQRRQLRKTRLMRHKKRSYQHKMTTSNSIKDGSTWVLHHQQFERFAELGDQSVCNPVIIVEDIFTMIRDFFI